MIDPILQHLYKEAVAEAKMPKCECCENAIWDDELVDIEGKIYCMRCARQLFVKYTDDLCVGGVKRMGGYERLYD